MSAKHILKTVFGFDDFRPGQERIIKLILNGRSALAVFPTGSGKSLCYQLPATLLDGLTIVISPLIALMKDQVDFLRKKGVAAARLDSTLDFEETRKVYEDVRSGGLKLLYIAPERMANERFLFTLRRIPIALMVVDEAHCISEWGHNFRPEYLKLAITAKRFKVSSVLALTATATPCVTADICREFDIAPDAYLNTGFYRPNLTLNFTPTPLEDRIKTLKNRVASLPRGATIVYVTLQKTAMDVAEGLANAGLPARPYHAGMKNEARSEIQEWFMASDQAIVVATIAFGMGIDKSDIRYVYHFNLPKTLENYSQEIGRAGRDGAPAFCEVLGSFEDMIVLENFIFGDTPTKKAIEKLVTFILEQRDEFAISVYDCSQRFDIRPLVIKTLLTYLELTEVIRFTSPFYNTYKFKPLLSSQKILEKFDPERRRFLNSLFKVARAGHIWFSVELNEAANQLNEPRERIVSAFNYLAEQGLIELKVTGLRQGIRLLRRPDRDKVQDYLLQKVKKNESANIKRTLQVMNLLNVSRCKTRFLLAYFGEKLDHDCGHCHSCLNGTTRLITRPRAELSKDEHEIIGRLQQELFPRMREPVNLVRFLSGVSSPAFNRSRLTKHPQFATLAHIPFATLMVYVKNISLHSSDSC